MRRQRTLAVKVEAVGKAGVLRGGELFGCRKTIWYLGREQGGKREDRSDRWKRTIVWRRRRKRGGNAKKREKRWRGGCGCPRCAAPGAARASAGAAPKSSAVCVGIGHRGGDGTGPPRRRNRRRRYRTLNELVTRACDAIVARSASCSSGGEVHEAAVLHRAPFAPRLVRGAREFAAIVAAEAEGDAGDPPAMVDALAVLERRPTLSSRRRPRQVRQGRGPPGHLSRRSRAPTIFCPDVMGRRLAWRRRLCVRRRRRATSLASSSTCRRTPRLSGNAARATPAAAVGRTTTSTRWTSLSRWPICGAEDQSKHAETAAADAIAAVAIVCDEDDDDDDDDDDDEDALAEVEAIARSAAAPTCCWPSTVTNWASSSWAARATASRGWPGRRRRTGRARPRRYLRRLRRLRHPQQWTIPPLSLAKPPLRRLTYVVNKKLAEIKSECKSITYDAENGRWRSATTAPNPPLATTTATP